MSLTVACNIASLACFLACLSLLVAIVTNYIPNNLVSGIVMDFLLSAIAISLSVAYSKWFKHLLGLAFNHWSEEFGHRPKLVVKLFCMAVLACAKFCQEKILVFSVICCASGLVVCQMKLLLVRDGTGLMEELLMHCTRIMIDTGTEHRFQPLFAATIPAFLSFLASLLPAVPVPVVLPTQGVEGSPELLGQTVLQQWFAAALRDLFTLLPQALVPNLPVPLQPRELVPLVPNLPVPPQARELIPLVPRLELGPPQSLDQ